MTSPEVDEQHSARSIPKSKPNVPIDVVVEGEAQSGTHGVSCAEALRSYHGEPALASRCAVRGPPGQGTPSHVHSEKTRPGPRMTKGWHLQVDARRGPPR